MIFRLLVKAYCETQALWVSLASRALVNFLDHCHQVLALVDLGHLDVHASEVAHREFVARRSLHWSY